MQISKVNSKQSFGSTRNNEAFEFSNFLDSTGKRTAQLTDLFIAANSAIGSPEEATIKILNNRLDEVVNDKKTPGWVRKPATYISAAAISVAAYIAATKSLKTPGIALRYMKRKCANNKFGQSVLRFGTTIKESALKVAKALKLKDNKYFNKASQFISKEAASARDFITGKFPKVTEKISKAGKFLKIDKWNKKDYLRNIFAGYIGFASGKRYINKHSDAVVTKPQSADNLDDLEIRAVA